MKIKTLKKYLHKKHKEYYDELRGMDMDDTAFNFLLGQKAGIEEAIHYIKYEKDIYEDF